MTILVLNVRNATQPDSYAKITILSNSKTLGNAGTKLGLRTKIAAILQYLNEIFPSSFLYIFGNKGTYSN